MRDLVRALMEVAQADAAMAADVWVLVFPIVWATLSERKQQQVDLAKPIISLLSREYHMRQAHARPNVVQARPSPAILVRLVAELHIVCCMVLGASRPAAMSTIFYACTSSQT